jgi:dTDP-4-amino-4,6-dideoxygalactose transaminase
MTDRIPFMDLHALHEDLRPELDRVWSGTLASSGFVGGEAVDRFEDEFARYVGSRHAIGVANGTDALELVLRGLGIGAGDEVIVPANTFYATAEAVHMAGALPVFVDVDPDTLLTTPAIVEAAVGARTAAVIVVHLFGQPVDLDGFRALSERLGVPVIEDSAQAHGARWGERRAGSAGVAGCFSFYPGKNLGALGDGGAVVTDDADLAARVRSLANHGRDPSSPGGHGLVGRNSRLDGLQAGVLSCKLPHLDGWNARRREIWSVYETRFAGGPVVPVTVDARATSVHHLAVVRVRERDTVRSRLDDHGVATGIHYPVPCHRLPPVDGHHPLPEVERAADEILSLPMYPHLDAVTARTVAELVLDAAATEVDRASA